MIIEADLTWVDGELRRGIQVEVENGRISRTGALEQPPTHRLEGQMLLPGFISAHSHAFQRALRGQGETFPSGQGSFWTWREAMYELVGRLDEERFLEETRATYQEMLAAGITTVGEFHYLPAFDELVLRAASEAGIRICVLVTYYKTGGIGQPLSPAQKAFETRTLDEFFARVSAIRAQLDGRTQSLGIAAHSIRGVPLDELEALYGWAREHGLPFHMHVEEQRREIEDCVRAYGRTPMQLLNKRLPSCDGFTAVHATHSEPAELQRFLDRGGSVCVTPLTEANLGDGIPDVAPLLAHPDRLSLGTDSNARVSLIEEMRWLEYAQRLESESRGIFRDAQARNAARLLEFATASGARALDVNAGRILAGAHADFVAVEATNLESLIFGGDERRIRATCVAGEWR